MKKYRNAEYTAAACKFWGGKKFFGVQGKIFIRQGAINIGFQYWVQYWVEYPVKCWVEYWVSILGFNIGFNIWVQYWVQYRVQY